jgi:hypothetical protein
MDFKDFQDVAGWTSCVKLEMREHKGTAATDKEAWKRAKKLYDDNDNFSACTYFYDHATKTHGPPPMGMAAFRIRFGFGGKETKDAVLVDPKTGTSWATGGLRELVPIEKPASPGKLTKGETVANVSVMLVDGKPLVMIDPPTAGWEDHLIETAAAQRLVIERKQLEQQAQFRKAQETRDADRQKAERKSFITKKRKQEAAAATGGGGADGGSAVPASPGSEEAAAAAAGDSAKKEDGGSKA